MKVVNNNLKQRIVGALVLIALAIIFIPLVFDFSGSRQVDTGSQIPPMPDIKAETVPEPVKPENITPAKSDEDIFQFGVETKEQGSALNEEAPKLEDGLPVSWVLQIGSFRDKSAADTLVKQLLNDGYQAFIRVTKKDGANLSRVFVGPKVLKKKLVQEKGAIDKKYNVDSILVRFEP